MVERYDGAFVTANLFSMLGVAPIGGAANAGELVVDGRGLDGKKLSLQGYEKGFYMGGSLFDHVTPEMSIYKEEIFGPVLCVIPADSEADAIDERLRSIMEKTASFFGHADISFCLKALNNEEDLALYNRALNLLSHGKYAIHEPTEMGEDNKDLFRRILEDFTTAFQFDLPEILGAPMSPATSATTP